jgi:hypothetical protein
MQNNLTPGQQHSSPLSLNVHTTGQQLLTPIRELKSVTVESSSAFFADIKYIEALLEAVPVLLQNDRTYLLRLEKSGALETSCPSRGIDRYEVVPGGSPLTQLTETPEGTLLTFQTPEGLRTVLLKRDAATDFYSQSYDLRTQDYPDSFQTNRRTSPWRKTSYDDDDNTNSSESHGSIGGER